MERQSQVIMISAALDANLFFEVSMTLDLESSPTLGKAKTFSVRVRRILTWDPTPIWIPKPLEIFL